MDKPQGQLEDAYVLLCSAAGTDPRNPGWGWRFGGDGRPGVCDVAGATAFALRILRGERTSDRDKLVSLLMMCGEPEAFETFAALSDHELDTHILRLSGRKAPETD